MAATEALPAFNAFESQLRTLCLTEFPCGIGGWRENHRSMTKTKTHTNNDTIATQFSITLRDFGAEHEKTETLQEFVRAKRSPWSQDYSWSDEAKQLREIAVKSPWLIDEKFVLAHFKTLRILDKKVTEVDENFLWFTNLSELSLSANYLQTVNSANLPPNLQVLELCANQISSLADLCTSPPPLLHLGLGHNQLCTVEDYISHNYWPHLLSLDLSHNNLSDLLEIVRKLQTLPKLHNLILQGNPLSLIPGYRGYTIDSLRSLAYFDDISISADERYHFKGLTKKREYVLDEAKVTLQVDYLKGIPMPEELQNPEEQPEYPIVTRKYYIQFMFPEDKSANTEIYQLMLDDQLSTTQPTEGTTTGRESGLSTIRESEADIKTESHSGGGGGGSTDRQSLLTETQNRQHTPALTHESEELAVAQPPDPDQSQACFMTQDEAEEGEGRSEVTEVSKPEVKIAAINSGSSAWAEQMEIMWKKRVVRDDLVALRDFFKQGMDITVLEEKVLSYPAEQVQDGVLSPAPSSRQSRQGKKGDKNKDKRDAKTPVKPEETPKKKKKKGEPEVELAHMPAEYTTLSTFHIPLSDFLDGNFDFEQTFIDDSFSRCESPMSEVGKKKDAKKDKKKPGSAKKAGSAKKKDGKEKDGRRSKSPKGSDKKESKLKAKIAETEGESPPPPPPLEVCVGVHLEHWKTAVDSLKQDDEQDDEQQQQQETKTTTKK